MSDHVPKYVYHPFFDQMVLVSPPVAQFISVTQAISWIAYNCFVDPHTLYVALERADGETYKDAHVRLSNATALLMRGACTRRLLLIGRHSPGGIRPLAITPVEKIDSELFWDHRRFDVLIDGIGLGEGIAWPLSSDELVYQPSSEAFHNVKLELSSFLKYFNDHDHIASDDGKVILENRKSSQDTGVFLSAGKKIPSATVQAIVNENDFRKKPGPQQNEHWNYAIEEAIIFFTKLGFARPLKRGQKTSIQNFLLEKMDENTRVFSAASALKHANKVVSALPMRRNAIFPE